jgi:VWFA-related protein
VLVHLSLRCGIRFRYDRGAETTSGDERSLTMSLPLLSRVLGLPALRRVAARLRVPALARGAALSGLPATVATVAIITIVAVGIAAAATEAAAPAPPAVDPASAPPSPAAGTEAPPAAGESFGEAIEVTVVNVDVVVRDKSGKQVGGLTRDDFSLFVDGKKVEIANFSSQAPAAPVVPGRAAPAPGAPAPAVPADGGAARERLSLVVFVDNANMRPFDRNRLLKQLRGFLDKTLQPGDQVLLVTHDLGLHTRHTFGDRPETLAPALDALTKEAAAGLNRDLELGHTMDDIQDVIKTQGCTSGADVAFSEARAHQEQRLAEAKVTYGNLHNLLKSLDGVEGRKALIYVGDGVATQVGTDVFGLIEELCPQNTNRTNFQTVNALAPLHQVIADANASRVTFYTLEATGQPSYNAAEHGRPAVSFDLAQRIDQDRQDSLTSLARETGGRAALNGSDFRHDLEEIGAEITNAYSLGFTPPPGPAGKPHTIKVELNRPGLRATYRAGYRDRTAEERMEGVVEAALIHGQIDNPLGAAVKVGAGVVGERNRVTVPISLRVPFGKLAFVPREDGRHAHVTIFVGNMDAKGGLAPIQRAQLPLRIPEADAKRILASQMGYDLKVVVEPGRQRIALAVRDDVARVSSSVIQEIDVSKTGTATAIPATPATPTTQTNGAAVRPAASGAPAPAGAALPQTP